MLCHGLLYVGKGNPDDPEQINKNDGLVGGYNTSNAAY
jgi:hypothetical protein